MGDQEHTSQGLMQPIVYAELPLDRVGPAGDLRPAFLRVQQPWVDDGIARWLDLVAPAGGWPVTVLAAWTDDAPDRLLATLVGVWAPAPIDRFDDLLEGRAVPAHSGTDRPSGGVWHFIAVTTAPEAKDLSLSRPLLAEGLAWVTRVSPTALARTLSPAVGLPALAERLQDGDFRTRAQAVLRRLSDVRGRPALPILSLHPGAGATLEKVLWDSRADEIRSGRVTLRFAYPLDPQEREANRQRFQAWVARRAEAVQRGEATPVPGLSGLCLVPDCGDEAVFGPEA